MYRGSNCDCSPFVEKGTFRWETYLFVIYRYESVFLFDLKTAEQNWIIDFDRLLSVWSYRTRKFPLTDQPLFDFLFGLTFTGILCFQLFCHIHKSYVKSTHPIFQH